MTRRMLIVKPDGTTSDYAEVLAPNEKHLQDLVKAHPELLPLDDLGLSGPLMVVGRETNLASGAIDLAGMTSTGEVVLVEFKTGPQNPDFRAALAQLVDYGSDLWRMSTPDFDKGVVQRYLGGDHCPPQWKKAASLQELASMTWNLSEADWEQLLGRLAQVLADGDFYYVVASQRFTSAMTVSLDYLNAVTRAGRYYLVQVVKLDDGDGNSAYSAQIVAAPGRKSASTSPATTITHQAFLDALPDGDYRDAIEEIIAACQTLGLKFGWGSKGTSIRLQTPDRPEPLSVAWLFPEGAQWSGLRHLSLGYDTAASAATPSVRLSLDIYSAAIAQIPGGEIAKGKTISARTFGPALVPQIKDDIVRALEALVAATQTTTTEDAAG